MNRARRFALCSALCAGLFSGLSQKNAYAFGWPGTNDEIFPPAAAAKPSINFDNLGFLIHGKRVFIVGGDLQYNRIPRAQWRDRILRIKRAGYNTIQTYVFWNFHEPKEGQFDFSGDHDLDAFLKLAKSLDMYVSIRIGPYVNADADMGGLPNWLRFNKLGLKLMVDNQPFYNAVEPYWRKLMPIVAANQIHKGGPVIMVQLENENSRGTGTQMPDEYYKHYYRFARAQGLVVPMFFSGLNHNDVPAGPDPIDTSNRHSPWMSSEFWTGWIAWYGVAPERAIKLDRATWGVIAYGGGGYVHYEMAGGTDFGALNCDEDGASYDFGAPIGQAGDFRDDYYMVKRSAMFATSFPQILANSGAENGGFGASVTNPAVRLTGRKGPAGTILFLDNAGTDPQPVQVKTADGKLYPASGPVTVQPHEYFPMVQGYAIAPGVTLDFAATRILGVTRRGPTTTSIVIHGSPGELAEMRFSTANATAKTVMAPKGKNELAISRGRVVLVTKFSPGKPVSYAFSTGGQVIHILAETSGLADRTWFVPINGQNHIITGVDYVGEVTSQNGKLKIDAELRGLSPSLSAYPLLDFGPAGVHPLTIVKGHGLTGAPAGPKLSDWQADSSVPKAQPHYDDSKWMKSVNPLPMGADNSADAYAWYRTTVHVATAGQYELYFADAGDWLTCFVNGKRADSTAVQQRYRDATPRRIHVTLPAGDSHLAFLTAHYGRNKLVEYYGPVDVIDRKGITDRVTISKVDTKSEAVTGMRWHAGDPNGGDAATYAAETVDTSTGGWQDYQLNTDVFNGQPGGAWVRAALPSVSGLHHKLEFQSIDDACIVYLNGKRVGEHQGVGVPFTIDLDSAWRTEGPNTVAILVQNTAGAGGIFWSLNVLGGEFDSGPEVHNWKMLGGEAPPAETSTSWKPLKSSDVPGVPSWYRTRFTGQPLGSGPHPILRATWTGLSRGFIWLNGHNLGRYPERAPINGLYLPECWIKPGQNTLEIFDEEGQSPSQVQLEVNVPESRTDLVLGESL